jgi:hypothetical protein
MIFGLDRRSNDYRDLRNLFLGDRPVCCAFSRIGLKAKAE